MDLTNAIYDICLKRGFFYPSYEPYGGASGFYDYGPLGAWVKRRIENVWRRMWVTDEGFFEIDTANVGVEDVFRASGHLGEFEDPTTDCAKCGKAFRADHLVLEKVEVPVDASYEQLTDAIHKNGVKCPECGSELGDVYGFNLMFHTTIGPGSGRVGYIRPETAQGMFYAFPRLFRAAREKLPFGVAQIGRAYRNEISPRQGMMRLREFNQMEVEIFVMPDEKKHPGFTELKDMEVPLLSAKLQEEGGTEPVQMRLGDAVSDGVIANELLAYCLARTYEFLMKVGLDSVRVRLRQHLSDEMAHYAADCWDVEALLQQYGWVELVGVADRTDYDLKGHARASGDESSFSVLVPYPEPKKVKRIEVDVDMKKLGPLFKGEAGAVADALKALDHDSLKGKKIVTVDVGQKKVKVPSDVFKVDERETTETGKRVIPHVVEPSFGTDRILFAALEHSLRTDIADGEERVFLSVPDAIAPFDVAVLPLLSNRQKLLDVSAGIVATLRESGLNVDYDDSGSIGRRYRRQDEVGTPLCITVDLEGLEVSEKEWTVTLRDRDFMEQRRVLISELTGCVPELLSGNMKMDETGIPYAPPKSG
jgi:glycyl-tRNA synthetase